MTDEEPNANMDQVMKLLEMAAKTSAQADLKMSATPDHAQVGGGQGHKGQEDRGQGAESRSFLYGNYVNEKSLGSSVGISKLISNKQTLGQSSTISSMSIINNSISSNNINSNSMISENVSKSITGSSSISNISTGITKTPPSRSSGSKHSFLHSAVNTLKKQSQSDDQMSKFIDKISKPSSLVEKRLDEKEFTKEEKFTSQNENLITTSTEQYRATSTEMHSTTSTEMQSTASTETYRTTSVETYTASGTVVQSTASSVLDESSSFTHTEVKSNTSPGSLDPPQTSVATLPRNGASLSSPQPLLSTQTDKSVLKELKERIGSLAVNQSELGVPPHSKGGAPPLSMGGVPLQSEGGVLPQSKVGVPPQSKGGVFPQSKGGVFPQSKRGLLPQSKGGEALLYKGVVPPQSKRSVSPQSNGSESTQNGLETEIDPLQGQLENKGFVNNRIKFLEENNGTKNHPNLKSGASQTIPAAKIGPHQRKSSQKLSSPPWLQDSESKSQPKVFVDVGRSKGADENVWRCRGANENTGKYQVTNEIERKYSGTNEIAKKYGRTNGITGKYGRTNEIVEKREGTNQHGAKSGSGTENKELVGRLEKEEIHEKLSSLITSRLSSVLQETTIKQETSEKTKVARVRFLDEETSFLNASHSTIKPPSPPILGSRAPMIGSIPSGLAQSTGSSEGQVGPETEASGPEAGLKSNGSESNPAVRKLVYSQYREMLRSYSGGVQKTAST